MTFGKRHLPAYLDGMIAARGAGQIGRDLHLGFWLPHQAGGFTEAQARLTTQMLDLAGLRPGQAVLDVACGFGGALAQIDARFAEMRLVGLNIDPRQLALCRDAVCQQSNRLALVQANATALPFRPASFDQLLCIEAMFHFAARRGFLAQAAAVLKPGGQLAMCDILLRPPRGVMPWPVAQIAAVIRRDYGPWPELWVDCAELIGWADQAGLELVARQDWTDAVAPSWPIVAPPAPFASAGTMLRWLHEQGALSYPALLFRRRG
jgi:MPBQ/MSBQ methyltransferase